MSATGEKLPFIVMEFVNGRTLKEVLAQEQRLQPRRALEIIADIDAALEFSHRHGIIHRDIKPGNVMITQNGQVKVMDFGIARALASGATTMTQTSAVIGTAQYLSPEQARGEAVDARSDVYAAGCVLFELLVGHPPFVGDSPVSVAYQHVREDPKAPSDINPEVPRDVDAIVLKALAKNPMNRYQSAQEMRADALRAVSGRPVLATPVMSQAETMALGNQQATRYMQPQDPTTMQRPIGGGPPRPPERRNSSWVMAVLAGLGVLVVVVLGVALAMSRNGNKPTDGGTQQAATAVMPNIKGKTDAEARAALTAQKFTNITPEQPKTDKDCDGTVVNQDPQANATVPVDTPVSYQLCVKPDKVPVPDNLVGNTKDNVDSILKNLGLNPDYREVSSAQPAGTVTDVKQSGQNVDPGSTVNVSVSKGNRVKMPKVTGETEDVATALLEQAGPFNVDQQTVPVTDPAQVGIVQSQNPKPGATVEKGDKVTIVIGVDAGNPSGNPTPTDTGTPGGNGGGTGGGQVVDQAAAIIRQD
jgi:serine/threonine-protein kinase